MTPHIRCNPLFAARASLRARVTDGTISAPDRTAARLLNAATAYSLGRGSPA